jgi:hypothetical protein
MNLTLGCTIAAPWYAHAWPCNGLQLRATNIMIMEGNGAAVLGNEQKQSLDMLCGHFPEATPIAADVASHGRRSREP